MSGGMESLGGLMANIMLTAAGPDAERVADPDAPWEPKRCEICGGATECRTTILGTVYTVPCMCRCQEEAYAEKERRFKAEQRRIRISDMRINGISDESLRDIRFDDAESGENIEKCRMFVEHWDEIQKQNTGLLMTGPVGTGKTYAAACIANALIDRGIPVLMTSFPVILGTSKFEMNDIIRQAMEYDLIIVDDLGVERDTEYSAETVFQFIDARYRCGKPMIVTTNLSVKDLKENAGIRYKRIYDRILEMCLPMVFSGESRRAAKRKEKAGILREILRGGG